MPYENEFAQYRSIIRIAESEHIKKLLRRCAIKEGDGNGICNPPPIIDIKPSEFIPKLVVAIDGSKQEVPLRNGFPGAEISYMTVASVLIDLEKLTKLDQIRPIDPKAMREVEKSGSLDDVFPGCNVVLKGDPSAKDSFRRILFERLSETKPMGETAESLLQTYQALLKYRIDKPDYKPPLCPYNDCRETDKKLILGMGEFNCSCTHHRPLFSSDALRLHEGFNDSSSNVGVFSLLLQVLERLYLINILRTIERQGWLSCLKRLSFVMDGPLAVFGYPSWLCGAISSELKRINLMARQANKQDILILGIEKSGAFPTHFQALDTNPDGSPDRLHPQTVMLLTDGYIKQNIIFSESIKPYGDEVYFGRKFFYKTKSKALIVANLPFLEDYHEVTSTAEPSQFPRIEDSLNVIDHLVSSRYPNALVPLISAHAEASIPMNLGRKVLEKMAKELINGINS